MPYQKCALTRWIKQHQYCNLPCLQHDQVFSECESCDLYICENLTYLRWVKYIKQSEEMELLKVISATKR